MKNSLRSMTLTLAFALLLICTGAVLAQTPDGGTPAEETVCDNETGSAYGHCNAYCEAMDCDSDHPQASTTACSKVRAKFQQTTGRDLPCEAPPLTCPCNDPAFSDLFAHLVSGVQSAGLCQLTNGGESGIFLSVLSPGIDVFASSSGSGFVCGTLSEGSLPISQAQFALCSQLLQQAADRDSVTCTP